MTDAHAHVVVSQDGDCANHQKHCMILGPRYASMQSCFDPPCLASTRTVYYSFDAPRAVGAKASLDVIILGCGCLVSVLVELHSFGVPLSLSPVEGMLRFLLCADHTCIPLVVSMENHLLVNNFVLNDVVTQLSDTWYSYRCSTPTEVART